MRDRFLACIFYLFFNYSFNYLLYVYLSLHSVMGISSINIIYIIIRVYIYTTHTLQPALLFQSSHGVICKKVILPPQNDTNQLV